MTETLYHGAALNKLVHLQWMLSQQFVFFSVTNHTDTNFKSNFFKHVLNMSAYTIYSLQAAFSLCFLK